MKSLDINFIASIKDDQIENIGNIVKSFNEVGCEISDILTFSGIITGSIAANLYNDLLKIEGVKQVEIERSVKAIQK